MSFGRGAYGGGVTVVASADKHVEGVTGNCVAIHRIIDFVSRTGQVTINAMNVGLDMAGMDGILHLILVTTGAQGIGGGGGPGFLGMDFMAVNTRHSHSSVAAGGPFGQCAGMAGAAQVFGGSNAHAFLRVSGLIRTVTGLAGDPGQHKLSADGIVACRVAGKALTWLFGLLQINLEYRIK